MSQPQSIDTSLNESLNKIKRLKEEGKFSEALNLIKEIEDTFFKYENNKTKDKHLELETLKSRILEMTGEYDKALLIANGVMDELKGIDNKILSIRGIIAKVYPLFRLAKNQDALDVISEGEIIINSLNDEQREILKEDIAALMNTKGVVSLLKGKLDIALDCLQNSLILREEIGNQLNIATSLNNIGLVYQAKGELVIALDHHQRSLTISTKIGNKYHIATSLNNIGAIFNSQGDHDAALENFHKSVALREEIGNDVYTSGTIYRIILTYIDKNDLEKARIYLEKIALLNQKIENAYIDLLERLAESMILKNSGRSMFKIDAQRKLEEIIDEEIIDFRLTIFAMINLSELLLEELKFYGEKEVMKEVQNLSEKISDIAREQTAYNILAESFVIQSKIALLNMNTTKAKSLLAKAQLIADEKGFKRLAEKISFEHDKLLDKLDQWNDYIGKNASFAERIEFIEFEKLINDVIHQKFNQFSLSTNEDPVMLLIIDEGGLPRFTKKFISDNTIHENLIGSFLSAINSFGKEAFSSNLPFERMKHHDFSIVMKLEKPLLFCYVFKGQSYSATQKITTIAESVKAKLHEIWDQLNNPFSAVVSDEDPDMNSLIDEIIYSASPA